MHVRIGLTLAALMGATACGVADEPSEAASDGGAEGEAAAPRSFEVHLGGETTTESVIPQILEAGRAELAAACADRPEAAIRIFNPLDQGAYVDIPCASTLRDGDTSTTTAHDQGDEQIDTAQQPLSPIGLGCSIFMFGATMVATSAICPRARDPRDAQRCSNHSGAPLGTLGVLCSLI
ncbi:hypothetical protein WMF31_15105 [Sorangium sp. So ce1036]|uniref:hypothetical protein n=1 Tax=Sorangium sp. So ce1036 TaxID=3133328 RepID=UPI003EFDE278